MKRYTGFSSGMSNYSYSAKKTVWKWTPAKIAAFSLFGVMMAALVYFESSSGRTSYEPVINQNQAPATIPSTDFEKEYQEFLKQGRKIVSQETLDSLNSIQSSPASETTDDQPAALKDNNSLENTQLRSTAGNNRVTASSISKSPVPVRTPENVENNLESVDPIPPASNSQRTTGADPGILGTLEEANPNEYQSSVSNRNNNTVPDKTITEEFYIEETITGKVASLSDGTPIEGVLISVEGTAHRAVSDSNGVYRITVPGDPTQRTIQFSYQGRSTERDVAPGTSVVNILF